MKRIFLIAAIFLISIAQSAKAQVAPLCTVGMLPPEIRNRLRNEFKSWNIQGPSNLSANARKTWESTKPVSCPGLAIGHFVGSGAPTYAVLLVSANSPSRDYKLLVFTPPRYDAELLEESKDSRVDNYFLRTVSINTFFDLRSQKKFHVAAKKAFLIVDSGEEEYGAEIYFWGGDRFRHEPVDY